MLVLVVLVWLLLLWARRSIVRGRARHGIGTCSEITTGGMAVMAWDDMWHMPLIGSIVGIYVGSIVDK